VPADLDLGVGAAVILDLAVRVDATEVAGAVQPAARRCQLWSMNRSAVKSGLPTYPAATPRPPMQISPIAPSGTRRRCSSSNTTV